MPWADVLYGCDAKWWAAHDGCSEFCGVKWSSHNNKQASDDKTEVAERYGLNLVKGKHGSGFSTDQNFIHYNDNSGAQALNLAILLGATYIVLVGYDLRHVQGKSHFFGDHPSTLHQRNEYESFCRKFGPAPDGVTIINATPNSALKVYPQMVLEDAITHDYLRRNGAEFATLAD